MLSRVGSHFRGNVIGYLALFVALSGTAYATVKINGKNIKNNTVHGKQVKESTLKGVNAAKVGGLQVRKIRFVKSFNNTAPATTVLNLGGLKIIATCRSTGDKLDVKATTTKPASSVYLTTMNSEGGNDANTDAQRDIGGQALPGGFDANNVLEVDNAFQFLNTTGDGTGTLQYAATDGSEVVVHLALDKPGSGCKMTGMAIGG